MNHRVNPSRETDRFDKNLFSKGTLSTLPDALHSSPIHNKFLVVWLDADINETDAVYQTSIARIRRVFMSLQTFTDAKDCLKSLSTVRNDPVLLVVSSELLPEVWSRVKNMPQIHSIYVLIFSGARLAISDCDSPKVRGIFDRVGSICSALKRGVGRSRPDSLVMSTVPEQKFTKIDLPQLNQLFIYGFSVKQISLELKYDPQETMRELTRFCRTQYFGNQNETKIIKEFERNYQQHSPIWWYTRDCFVSALLTRALQTQDVEAIIRFGFFIKDLQQQIDKLHAETMKTNKLPIVAYRSQHISNEDLAKMKESKGNLLAFTNFLLADPDYNAALEVAHRTRQAEGGSSVLFCLKVESKQTSSSFASLHNVSFSSEKSKSILFSMHSIFRINDFREVNAHLWEVDLTLVEANNEAILSLLQLIKEETQDATGWYKLAELMTIIRDYDHAREIHFALLELTPESDVLKLAHVYNELGVVDDAIGDYTSALQFYQRSIDIRREFLPPNHPSLSVSYNNIGEVQRQMGDYFSALSTHQKTLDIKQRSLRPWDLSFATTYNNIGLASELLGEYSAALEFYQKAVAVKLRALPHDHQELATSYNNIGELQRAVGNYPAALASFERVMNIRLKKYSPTDPSLAITYNNIGLIHRELGDFAQGIKYLEKSMEVKEKHFPPNHPSFAMTYNNIGDIRHQMGEFHNALKAYQTALDIQQKSLPANHPEIATTLTNMGVAHQALGNYKASLEFYEKALAIRKKALPENHPTIGTSYNNIGHVYQLMGEYAVANEYYHKTLKLQQKSLSPNHPLISATYNNLADIQRKLGNYKKGLALYEKSIEIKQRSLPPNHPTFVATYNNMGVLHQSLKQHKAALERFDQTLEIHQKTLPPNHPDLAAVYINMGGSYQALQEYSKSIECYEKALKIQEKALPANHPDLAMTHNNIATLLVSQGNFKGALEREHKAVEIAARSLPADHPHLLTFRNYLERIKAKVKSMEDG